MLGLCALESIRKRYVGLAYRNGIHSYMIQAIHTPDTHPDPTSFGIDEGEMCLLVEICHLSHMKGRLPLPIFIDGYMVRYRTAERKL